MLPQSIVIAVFTKAALLGAADRFTLNAIIAIIYMHSDAILIALHQYSALISSFLLGVLLIEKVSQRRVIFLCTDC